MEWPKGYFDRAIREVRAVADAEHNSKLIEGQEVWLRGKVRSRMNDEQVLIDVGEGLHGCCVIFEDASADIRREEP